ncbi:riboflavin synthase subunit alpha [Buchnera aphidicola (Mindarus keteleerifoliae)]|uniref:riboflavin synthase subunit alpha n=1 Tax=Buchnera aphidicola TaxID=9 RepID=UPI0031B6731F
MFSGIVQGYTQLVNIKKKNKYLTYVFKFKEDQVKNLNLGNSISHNGCCLTVSNINKNFISFDIISETLNFTNLKFLKIGEYTNFERASKFNDEIGGHIVSGHIMTMVKIKKVINDEKEYAIWVTVLNSKVMQFILHKGFICLDGMSLTIAKIKKNDFCVHIIPETLRLTTIGSKKKDDFLNLEVDYFTQIVITTISRFKKQKNL